MFLKRPTVTKEDIKMVNNHMKEYITENQENFPMDSQLFLVTAILLLIPKSCRQSHPLLKNVQERF